MTKKKRVPRGKPKPFTDEELDDLAEITPADIERAKSFASKYAGKKGRDLLNTKKQKPDD